ncbi:MAG: penicillin-binding protein 1C [Sideroxydans sp.]|nr:penicillin-binding protein 1C [Sideroxydans sp.]
MRFAGVKQIAGWIPWRSRKAGLLLGSLLFIVVLRLWPGTPLSDQFASSRSVLADNGELLRLTLAADEQFRLWTPLDEIAAPMQQAILLYEDRWFYWHPGINPWAIIRAAGVTATGSRRIGGSTITMQLARRLYGIDSRSLAGKLEQVLAAMWLELRYGKKEILEAYLNCAPFGGNIEGVGAASLVYLGKPARMLNVPEALNLAVIPQNPRKRLGQSSAGMQSEELREARGRLAINWASAYPQDARFAEESALQMSFHSRANLPFRAPHAVDFLLRSSTAREINSSINLPVQSVVERVLGEYVKSRASAGINNASAILVDTSTMQVKAMVGSADYQNDEIAGQVNGVFGKRSPGSTLKPYIYGLALDQGLIHSATILKDAPKSYGAFSPENFDGRFTGPIAAQDALIRSRNVPAVELASHLSRPSLYDFLKLAGVSRLASEQHYGLALVLGGGEVTMAELAQLNAMLANHGKWQELRYVSDKQLSPQTPLILLSPAAAYVTLDMLRQTPRPDTYAPARPAIAWKTGTSWGFRDAWTAGVFGRYVLVVWVGNFDGSGNPAFIGIEAAAPLFMRIVDALRAERLDPGEMAFTQPADLQRVEICTASGDIPNDACCVRSQAWFIAGKSPIRKSTLHRSVLMDTRTGKIACQPGPYTRTEIFEYWSSDMAAIFKQAGMPLRQPPSGNCDNNTDNQMPPSIVSPLRGVIHVRRLGKQEPVYLRAEAGTSDTGLLWFVDNTLIGHSKPGEAIAWSPPQSGSYLLRVVDSEGRADSRKIQFEMAD